MAVVGVTGASGFLGGALVPSLAREGYDLRLVDDLSGPIQVVHPSHPVTRCDFRSPQAEKILSDADVVLHLAAVSGVVPCAEDPRGSRAVNVEGTRGLLERLRDRRIPLAFASSFAVVGVPERLPITEETPPAPTHAYAEQKAEGEALVHALLSGTAGGAILRMSNLYGKYTLGSRVIAKGNVLNLFARQAWEGSLRVNAPGTQRRDFIHLEDVVAHWVSATRYLRDGRARGGVATFNVASGETASILELAERVRAAWAKLHPEQAPLRIEIVPNPRGSIELLQPEFSVDRRRTEKELGVRCRHDLSTSLEEILQGSGPSGP